jgi:hypothetical protein
MPTGKKWARKYGKIKSETRRFSSKESAEQDDA